MRWFPGCVLVFSCFLNIALSRSSDENRKPKRIFFVGKPITVKFIDSSFDTLPDGSLYGQELCHVKFLVKHIFFGRYSQKEVTLKVKALHCGYLRKAEEINVLFEVQENGKPTFISQEPSYRLACIPTRLIEDLGIGSELKDSISIFDKKCEIIRDWNPEKSP
jgi:hypothetical protein